MLLIAEDPRHADQLEAELRFFTNSQLPIVHFVEWETLPWDSFSPHQDIVSQRLEVLAELPHLKSAIVITTAAVLQQRLPPTEYVAARSLSLSVGQQLQREPLTQSLVDAGYLRVPQVSEHGEFAVRGSLIDIFPMGTDRPLRIDFFDDDIESLRHFSTDDQRSGERIEAVHILPAREVPLDADAIATFRHAYRERFEGQPESLACTAIFRTALHMVGSSTTCRCFSANRPPLLDYLPDNTIVLAPTGIADLLQQFWLEALNGMRCAVSIPSARS